MVRPIDAWIKDTCYFVCGTSEDLGPMEYPYTTDIVKLPSLNVGCGIQPIKEKGWINTDHVEGEGVDKVFDCQERWPLEDNSIKAIQCSHVVEHLDNPMGFFKEANRVLHRGGSMVIGVPHGRHSQAMADFDHRRPFCENNFYFLQMDFKATHNLDHRDKKPLWETKFIYHTYAKDHWINKWWIPRAAKQFCIEHLWNVCLGMTIWLKPIKEGA